MQYNKSIRAKIGNWKVDEDGFLKIKAVILKQGVFDYLEKEFLPESGSNKIIPVFIPASEFTPEVLESGEGKQVIVDNHDWQTVENALDNKMHVGDIAGVLEVKGNKIYCNILVKDAETIDKIKNKNLVEVSAGYSADFIKKPGVYNENPYEYRQENIRFNHILLLPSGEGRCGSDVRVLNKKTDDERKDNKMSMKIRYRVGNSDRTKEFSNEDDARKAEEMAEEIRESKDVDVKNALEKFEEIKKEVETKNAELEEARAEIEAIKQQIEEALSPEAQEALADEILEQREAEEDIVEKEFEEEEREEVRNACKAMNRSARAAFLARKVLNKKGVATEGMSEDALHGSFVALAAAAKAKVANSRNNGVVVGAKAFNASARVSNRDAIKRMFGKK